ncbi:MAG: protein kinase [Nannocystaceae bacterium]
MEPSRAAASAEPVSRLGRYLVVGLVGVGGMGRVLRADRAPAARWRSSSSSRGARWRWPASSEARAMARLRHQNLVPIDVGQDGDNFFIAMEFVDGTTLRGWLDESARPWRAVVEAFVGAGRGLAAAHGAGVVHRDFKPANVMVGGAGPRQAARENVRVVDFGLAEEVPSHELDVDARAERPGLDRRAHTAWRRARHAAGHMSPEQHFGGVVGPASGQFAFCVAAARRCTTRAFDGKDHHELASRKLRSVPETHPPWPRRESPGGCSARSCAVCRRPPKRWPSMDDLVAELERGQARVRRRRLVAAGAAASIVRWIALALMLDRHQRTACVQAGQREHRRDLEP